MPSRQDPDKPGTEVYDWGEIFLAAISEGKSPTRAAQEAGVSRQAPYERKWAHENFAKAWETAKDVRAELLEEAAFKRAVTGVTVSTTWEINQATGERIQTGESRKFSDALLALLLKKELPEYRDRVSIDATVSGRIEHQVSVLPEGMQPVEIEAAKRREAARQLLAGEVIEGNETA